MSGPIVLNLKKAAEALGVSTRKFYELRVLGHIPPPRDLGGMPVYHHEDLDRAIRKLPHIQSEAHKS